MRVITTESGSRYTIDEQNKTWYRERGENAAVMRTEGGEYIRLDFLEVKEGTLLQLLCPPINYFPRIITSTFIVKDEITE